MPLPDPEQLVPRGRGFDEPWWELVVDGGQLARFAERPQRLKEIPLLLPGRRSGAALLPLMARQAAVCLDVEAKGVRGSRRPSRHDARRRDAVKARVDLHQGEVPSVEAEPLLLAAAPQLVGIEVFVVEPVAGSDKDLRRSRSHAHDSTRYRPGKRGQPSDRSWPWMRTEERRGG